jgi:uncharacterized phiE125 gp8 family phage protein
VGYSTLITAPANPVVTLAEAKEHLAIEFSDDDDKIAAFVEAATGLFDAAGEGYLGRALVTQTWQLTLPKFPGSGHFVLPVPTVQQITGITYYDADNAQQTLSASTYRLTVTGEFACVDLVAGEAWPSTYDRADAVAVQYEAGYGDDGSDVPLPIHTAICIMAASYYEGRATADALPQGVRQLVANYRLSRGYI